MGVIQEDPSLPAGCPVTYAETTTLRDKRTGGGGSADLLPPPSRSIRRLKVCSFALGRFCARKKRAPPTVPSSLLEMAGEITETGDLYSPYVSFTFRTCFARASAPGCWRSALLPVGRCLPRPWGEPGWGTSIQQQPRCCYHGSEYFMRLGFVHSLDVEMVEKTKLTGHLFFVTSTSGLLPPAHGSACPSNGGRMRDSC